MRSKDALRVRFGTVDIGLDAVEGETSANRESSGATERSVVLVVATT